MGKYRILVEYRTGDSFNSEDTSDYLELEWDNLDVAKANLQRIKEHYDFQNAITGYAVGKIKSAKILEDNIDKDWFVNIPKLYSKKNGNAIEEKHKEILGEGNWEYKPDPHYYEYCINLYTDSGNKMQLRVFWIGYFEQLYNIKIETNTEDMEISFI